ncbi:MAG: T9SS type A sorting domain-containing protein [Chitinophagaceae bacterium]
MKGFYKILLLTLFILGTGNLTPSFANNDLFGNDPKIRIIQCYPNPASVNINFEFNLPVEKNAVITVYNFIGKKVDEIKVTSNKIGLSLDNYYRGLYVYQLRDKQGLLLESGKFQVVK